MGGSMSQCLPIARDGAVGRSLGDERGSEIRMGVDQLRLEWDRRFVGRDRVVEPSGRLQHAAEVAMGLGEGWAKLDGGLKRALRLEQPAKRMEGRAAGGVGIREI